jgi:hypothetical protein
VVYNTRADEGDRMCVCAVGADEGEGLLEAGVLEGRAACSRSVLGC